MLSEKQIAEFRLLYKARFGEVLSDEQATYKAGKLLECLRLIYKPLTKAEFEKFSNSGDSDK